MPDLEEMIASEHRFVDALLEETRAAIRSADALEAGSAFGRLREEIEAHFQREDHLYYPAIRALRPSRRELLTRLHDTHREIRGRLDKIAAHLATAALAEAEGALEDFAEAFSRHEASERSLVLSLKEDA